MAGGKELSLAQFLRMAPQVPQYSDKNKHALIAGANPIHYLEDGSQELQAGPLAASVDWTNITQYAVSSDVNRNSGANAYAGSRYLYGQSFKLSKTITLQQATFQLAKTGVLSAETMYAEIYAHTGTFGSGTPTGAYLAISSGVTVGAAGLTGSYKTVTFTFSGPNAITLNANTPYFVVFTFAAGDATDYVSVGTDTGLTAAGNMAYSSDGTTWTADPTQDMCYAVLIGTTSSTIEGNVVHMIPSTQSPYSVYLITDTTRVYGVNSTTVFDCGYPSGSAVANSIGGYLAIANSYLFATYNSVQPIYKMPLSSGSWTTANAADFSSNLRRLMEPFTTNIAVTDMNAATVPSSSRVRMMDAGSFTTTGFQIDLGTGFYVLSLRNYNNKYLAIAAARSASAVTNGFTQNYLFLWDGASPLYNSAIRIPGKFIDMRVIDSTLYVAVQTATNKTVLYYLWNTVLRKVKTTQFSTINSTSIRSVNLGSLVDFNGYLGMMLNSTADITYPLELYGSDEVGPFDFVHSFGRNFAFLALGYDGYMYATENVGGGNSNLYYLNPAGTTYQQLFYRSQWIPVPNGVSLITIVHDTPPASITDAINVTISGFGKKLAAGTVTTALTPITSINYLDSTETELDVQGFQGDYLQVQLSTVNSTWRPLIRDIVITP